MSKDAPSHAHEIIPNLWLGDITSSQDINFHNYYKIDCVFNCTKDLHFIPKYKLKHKQSHYRLPVHDNRKEEELILFGKKCPEVIARIDMLLKKNKKILVHCYAGAQRSAAIVAMYIIFKFHLTPDDAIRKIKEIRPQAFYKGVNFKPAIYSFYKSLLTSQ